jgi:hypothetical protein
MPNRLRATVDYGLEVLYLYYWSIGVFVGTGLEAASAWIPNTYELIFFIGQRPHRIKAIWYLKLWVDGSTSQACLGHPMTTAVTL